MISTSGVLLKKFLSHFSLIASWACAGIRQENHRWEDLDKFAIATPRTIIV
jgi:hypothetical protein